MTEQLTKEQDTNYNKERRKRVGLEKNQQRKKKDGRPKLTLNFLKLFV